MTNDCICSNVPRIWRLAGVTRTVRLTVTKDGSPYDFTGLQTVLRIDRDNSDFHYEPQFTVEGDDNNIIVFTWAADKQPLGDYTIEVTVTDGSGNKDRVNWHGATGVRLVEYSNLVKGEDAAGVESDSELGLDGIFTMNGVGMDAYEEWLADGNEGSLHDYILWMQGPAREAAEVAEAQMAVIQSRADDDHTTAGSDHTRAAADHTTATGDHTRAEEDHTRAISDHTRAAQDHTSAVGDHMTAGQDHLRAEADHTTAGSDHTRAESDHATAASDHSTAASDHTKAGQDSTRAGSDHDIAVADHAQAEADHTRAESDHTTAAADHTTAASDHTTASSDHTTAAADHTQAVADHAVMAGYDTRLTNVETDVTQLGQEVNGYSWTEGKYLNNTGAEISDEEWGISDFVPYTAGNDVTWRWGDAHAVQTGRRLVFYDSDKNFISGSDFGVSGSSGQRTIAAASITTYAPNAAYLRASFVLADYAKIEVGSILGWENKTGIAGEVQSLGPRMTTAETNISAQGSTIQQIQKVTEGLFLPPESQPSQGFVRWETKGVESGGSNNQMFVIYPNGQKVLRYKVGQASNIDAAVAFYSTDDLTLTGESTFIDGVRAIDGVSEGIIDIPANCKLIIVADRADVLPLANVVVKTVSSEKDLRDRVIALEADDKSLQMTQRQGIVANNPFRFDKFYAHLGIENINSQCVIPSQSVFDIMYSKRLGFKYIEGNIRATSDGYAIVTHGNSGKFGGMFKLNPESTETDDIAQTMINTKTLAWIKQNVVYNSSIPKFCVAPLTPEEFCHACKLVGILPMIGVSSYDKNAYDAILGRDNYIADRLTVRGDCSAPILLYNPSLTTKEQIIAACDAVGAPVGFTFTNNLADYTDAELRDIVESMHKKGYWVGQVCCYQNEIATQRGWSLNFDYGCSNYQVNDFGIGNLLDIDGTIDFSDFYTDGTIADGKISIAAGQRIRPANEPDSVFFGIGMLTVKFTGTMKITMGPRLAHELTSDGENPMVFSTYYFQQSPSFLLQGIGTSGVVIEEIHFKSSKV